MDDLPLRRCLLLERSQLSYCHEALEQGNAVGVVLALPEELSAGDEARLLCKSLVAEARVVTDGKAFICLAIPAGEFYYQPYGDTPFAAGVAHFHELAAIAAEAGADCVMIHRARSMLQARAGVLGARASGLPVLVSMEPVGEGDSLLGGTDLLSAYAVLRLLGIAAFGYASSVTALQLPAFEAISAHRSIPLFSITQNLTGSVASEQSGELFARRTEQLARLGVGSVGIWGAGQSQLMTAAGASTATLPLDEDERGTLTAADLWAANETQVYYLDENVELGEPVPCHHDMTDDVLEAEREVCSLFCIELHSQDEAITVSINNGNLDQMPVALSSDDEAALEAALFYYNGRAVIDSRSHLDEEIVERLASQYGALIL